MLIWEGSVHDMSKAAERPSQGGGGANNYLCLQLFKHEDLFLLMIRYS